ncbi:DNA ligase [Stenotrophomonas phage Siara]|uniref:DNA ligase n=1 Tax=Stenotrophomonas phage Siara TaxID=2859658 RepID=A0AAE7WMB6_9CAUD|nr:DNA ligase [Stenotrophomonas phage Siara]QYW02070.1 DNA ligase [Stenotrophomonas phage Siara]
MGAFKPMKAVDAKLDKLRFPLILLPKVDGVRGLNVAGKALSRTLADIRNRWTRKVFSRDYLAGLDGEMIADKWNHPRLVSLTTSATSGHDDEPFVQWMIFDDFTEPNDPYLKRLETAASRVEAILKFKPEMKGRLRMMPYHVVNNMEELTYWEDHYLGLGLEGIILRDPKGVYKHGRGTVTAGDYLRVKRYIEALFKVTGVEEAMENTNEAEMDNLGHTKRSTAKAGMVPKGMVGKVHGVWMEDVEWNGKRLFSKGDAVLMGPGSLTHAEREHFWKHQEEFIGQLGKCKTFPIGVKEKPRFPLFVTLVNPDDAG